MWGSHGKGSRAGLEERASEDGLFLSLVIFLPSCLLLCLLSHYIFTKGRSNRFTSFLTNLTRVRRTCFWVGIASGVRALHRCWHRNRLGASSGAGYGFRIILRQKMRTLSHHITAHRMLSGTSVNLVICSLLPKRCMMLTIDEWSPMGIYWWYAFDR